MGAKPEVCWTDKEVAILMGAHRAGMTTRMIHNHYLPERSVKAIRNKLAYFGCVARRAKASVDRSMPIPPPHKVAVKSRHDPLLVALLRFGVRHDCDLGMGRAAFLARAAENGIRC